MDYSAAANLPVTRATLAITSRASLISQYASPIITRQWMEGMVLQIEDKPDVSEDTYERAPGGDYQVYMLPYTSTQIPWKNYGAQAQVPKETMMMLGGQPPQFRIQVNTTVGALRKQYESVEVAVAKIMTKPGNFLAGQQLTGTTNFEQFDVASPTLSPKDPVDELAKEITKTCQIAPNAIFTSYSVKLALRKHPKVLASAVPARYTEITIGDQELAKFFDVEQFHAGQLVIGGKYVWGDFLILAYVPDMGMREAGAPAFSYTYVMEGSPTVSNFFMNTNNGTLAANIDYMASPTKHISAAGGLLIDCLANE